MRNREPIMQTTQMTVEDAAGIVLDRYAGADLPGLTRGSGFEDPGMMVLAALVAVTGPATSAGPVRAAARRWASRSATGGHVHLGVHGRGLGGCVLGLQIAAEVWESARPTARRARLRLSRAAQLRPWSGETLGWPDYDLIMGPAGTLLALLAGPPEPGVAGTAVTRHLTALCDRADLAGLRVEQYEGDALRGFNHRRINTSPGHGVAGTALALVAAADAGVLGDPGRAALRRIGDWLSAQLIIDGRGLRTWPPAGRDDPRGGPDRTGHWRRRQGWCYGNPGTGWALWEIGRALGDQDLCGTATEAARSFIAAYDDDLYLDDDYPDRTGMCHGAAGTMAVFDAFHRHAALPGALGLREHLAGFIEARLDRVVGHDTTLLSGSTGTLAALLTVRHDTSRTWLRGFGLR
jgi:hypothetical protein